jgi:3-oxoacyl-[acyl-carrier protein] reductase
MSQALTNKVAIITGGGRGIGKAFALRFAEEGAKLLLPDISLERAEATVKEIQAKGGQGIAMQTDISDENDTMKMAEKVIEQYGKIDILLNNAATFFGVEAKPWDTLTVEEWDRIFTVNVRGTWLCCKSIAPLMVNQSKGKIINIASDIIKSPQSHMLLHYTCSKAAVYTMTQSLARALGSSGINVNAIAPGLTMTDATMDTPEEMLDSATKERCIPRREQPTDLVGTAVFLASADSDFITGQVIFVNGGCVMV